MNFHTELDFSDVKSHIFQTTQLALAGWQFENFIFSIQVVHDAISEDIHWELDYYEILDIVRVDQVQLVN